MKFEKRAAAGETPTEQEPQETGKKPVIVYILILFLAAFLLMFLSLLAHQRSTLGKLQNSVSAIQEIQATQEQIIELQEKVDAVEKERDEAEDKLKTSEDSAAALEKENNALLALYTLQQEYLTGNLDGCRLTLQEFSDQKLDELLPDTAPEGVTTPAQRYLELKEAILNHQ